MATHSSIFNWRTPMDRGAWWATVHGVAKSWTSLPSSTAQHTHIWTCQVALVVKNLPTNAGDIETGYIPEWEGLLEEGMATHSSILA